MLSISFGKNVLDTVPVTREISFSKFSHLIQTLPRHTGPLDWAAYTMAGKLERGRAKDTRWFIPAVFVRPERKANAVGSLSGFVCDFDDGDIHRGDIESYARASGQGYIAWTSFSNGLDGKEKYRVFIPYARPAAPSEHAQLYEYFNAKFGGHLDHRCGTLSQLWYLPGSPVGAPQYAVFGEDPGVYFDPGQAVGATPVRAKRQSKLSPVRDLADASIGGDPVGALSVLAARATDNTEITARGPVSIRDIESALEALDKTKYEDYTEWLNIGMAIYDGTGGSDDGLRIYDRWSSGCPGYQSTENVTAKWRSFGGREGLSRITAASLFKQARETGWEPGPVSGVTQQPHVQPAPVSLPGNPPVAGLCIHPGVVPAAVLPVLVGPPDNWQAHKTQFAMQKKVTDEDNPQGSWSTRINGFKVISLSLLRTIDEGSHTAEMYTESASGIADATFNTALVSTGTEFRGLLLERGILTSMNEFKELQELVLDWLKKIQDQVKVKRSFTHLGWMEKDTQHLGFALGDTAYYPNGTTESGIRVANGGGSSIVKHYLPQGNLQTWQSISAFLTSQGRPELLAILSTSFGSPLMKFSGHSGAVVSIVSTASGVGKSTALALAQSVWGSPKAAMHSATDTVQSLSSKMGFTKDLPAYWDDIKGEKTFEQFAPTIYQITQGKEKSRLNSNAELREVQNWNCLAVIAANDSLIEIVKRYGKGTDAGAARIFEMRLEQRPAMTQRATFFDQCTTNYGVAGAAYAAWLSANHDTAKKLVEDISAKLSTSLQVEAEERFWVAAMSTMIAGSMIAKRIGLVDFDVPALTAYLKARFFELRGSKTQQMKEQDPGPMVANMIYDHQQTTLRIEALPFKNRTKVVITRTPKNNEVDITIAEKDGIVRIRKAQLAKWCKETGHALSTLVEKLLQYGAIVERNTDPMAGATPYSSMQRTTCYDISLKKLNLQIGEADGDDDPA